MSTSGGTSGGGPATQLSDISANFPCGPALGAPYQSIEFQLNFASESTSGNYVHTLTSVPMLIAPGGNVVGSGVAGGLDFSVGVLKPIDTTHDDFILTTVLTVTNLAGTEALKVTGSGDIPMVGPGQHGSIDFTAAVAVPIAGIDLGWSGPSCTVTTTAGGVFVVSAYCLGDWD